MSTKIELEIPDDCWSLGKGPLTALRYVLETGAGDASRVGNEGTSVALRGLQAQVEKKIRDHPLQVGTKVKVKGFLTEPSKTVMAIHEDKNQVLIQSLRGIWSIRNVSELVRANDD